VVVGSAYPALYRYLVSRRRTRNRPESQGWWNFLADLAYIHYTADPYALLCDELAVVAYGNTGGQARSQAQRTLDEGVRKLHAAAVADKGPEYGAQVTAWLAAQDGQARFRPDWLLHEWRAHSEAVREVLEKDYKPGMAGVKASRRRRV
jgi:hypothetical protein